MIKCVFCGKFFYNSGTCVIIVVKPKYVNFGNMSNICGKLNFITNYTYVIIIDTHLIKTHTIFDIFSWTVPVTKPKYFRQSIQIP